MTDSETQEALSAAMALASKFIDSILVSCPNDFSELEKMVKQGVALWYQQEDGGLSALHAATLVQNRRLVQLLIDKGAVWNCGKLLYIMTC